MPADKLTRTQALAVIQAEEKAPAMKPVLIHVQ